MQEYLRGYLHGIHFGLFLLQGRLAEARDLRPEDLPRLLAECHELALEFEARLVDPDPVDSPIAPAGTFRVQEKVGEAAPVSGHRKA